MREQEQAFDAFVASAGPRLLRTAHLLTGDRGLAEDLLQDVLARTWLRWSRVEAPEAYVRRGLVNAQRNTWRRRAPRPAADPGPAVDVAADTVRVDAVARALRELSVRERQVVVWRYWADLTEAQTAAELGIAVGTVKSTAHRALAKLRASEHLTAEDRHERA